MTTEEERDLFWMEACVHLCNALNDILPLLAVTDPGYALAVCERLRQTVDRTEDSLYVDGALPGLKPLPSELLRFSSETSERNGETSLPAQD